MTRMLVTSRSFLDLHNTLSFGGYKPVMLALFILDLLQAETALARLRRRNMNTSFINSGRLSMGSHLLTINNTTVRVMKITSGWIGLIMIVRKDPKRFKVCLHWHQDSAVAVSNAAPAFFVYDHNRRYYLTVISKRTQGSIRCPRFFSTLSSAQNDLTPTPITSSWNFCYSEKPALSLESYFTDLWTVLLLYLLRNKDFTDSRATLFQTPRNLNRD